MRKFFLLFSVLSLAFLFLFSFSPPPKKIIIIDPGHGGEDFGAKKDDAIEKEITLRVAKYIKAKTGADDFEVVLLRESDVYPTLQQRIEVIEKLKPAFIISLHMNSTPEKETARKGSEIYIKSGDPDIKILADKLAHILENTRIFDDKKLKLLEVNAPVLLVEMGFLNNKEDRSYFTEPKGQEEMAQKIVKFLRQK